MNDTNEGIPANHLSNMMSFPRYVYHELSPVVGGLSSVIEYLKEGDIESSLAIIEQQHKILFQLHYITGIKKRELRKQDKT